MPQEEYHPPTITFGDTELKSVQQFTFLSCTISSDAMIDKEIDNRLAKANTTFGRLYENVWNKKSLKRKTRSAFTELLHSLLSSMAPRPGSHIAATSKSSCVSIVVYGVSIGNKGMPPSISIKNKGFKMASKSLREDSRWRWWRHRTWHHSRWRFNISIMCRCMRESTLRHPSEGGHLG